MQAASVTAERYRAEHGYLAVWYTNSIMGKSKATLGKLQFYLQLISAYTVKLICPSHIQSAPRVSKWALCIELDGAVGNTICLPICSKATGQTWRFPPVLYSTSYPRPGRQQPSITFFFNAGSCQICMTMDQTSMFSTGTCPLPACVTDSQQNKPCEEEVPCFSISAGIYCISDLLMNVINSFL